MYQKEHHLHNYKVGECRWYKAQSRTSTTRVKGAGRKRASAEPTAGLSGTKDGVELGAGDEAEAREVGLNGQVDAVGSPILPT